jgi:hypothetical protein|tara:strand:- start:342 stop:1226 length:885 start_codon:yes stop_codon:yes gene_type:complete
MEFDKSGAEWVVVAYASGDGQMIDVVKGDESPHSKTGMLISGAPIELVEMENKLVEHHTDPDTIRTIRSESLAALLEGDYFLPRSMSIRQAGKKSNHGLNYGMGYRRFALENEMEERDAKRIVDLYLHSAYPGIPVWWETIRQQLRDNRTLTNCFGRKREFRDAWGDELFKEAYAFIPQSTVVDMVNSGMAKAFVQGADYFDLADLLAQVHDSIVYQYPIDHFYEMALFTIRHALDYMSPTIQYSGREFQIGTDLKVGRDWGHMIPVELSEDVDVMQHNLEEAWDKLNASTQAG